MKHLRSVIRIAAAAILLLGWSTHALAQNNVDYSPAQQAVSDGGTATVYISLPNNLNGNAEFPGTVTIDVVPLVSGPDGGTPPVVTLSANTLTYSALGQTLSVGVTVDAGSASPGDWDIHVKAFGPPRIGFGNGAGAHVTFSVAEPQAPGAPDSTPPAVSITSPADGLSLVFCPVNPVNVSISASDADSVVSAVAAAVNGSPISLTYAAGNAVTATGAFLASAIGSYTITASATSEGGAAAADAVGISVHYDMTNGWLPPLSLGKTSKGGSTVPIKFTARDCSGNFVADSSVVVDVYEGSTLVFTAMGFPTTPARDYVRINVDDAQYITNFTTASGIHNYVIVVSFSNIPHATKGLATSK